MDYSRRRGFCRGQSINSSQKTFVIRRLLSRSAKRRKYLKALLILKDTDFPKTHDIPTLNTLCNEVGILTGLIPQQLIDLTEYAVHRRYPGNQPTPEEAEDAIEIAKSVRRFARSYLGLKK